MIKAIADYAEILQVEDLLHCSFHPLRNLGRVTMPEEKFHAQFGKDCCLELIQAGRGAEVQDAIDRYVPITPGFFGASNSKNNEMLPQVGTEAAHERGDARRLPEPGHRAGARRTSACACRRWTTD